MFFPFFGASAAFASIRKVLEKELRMGYYSISTFYVAQTVIPLPLELVLPTMWMTAVFWITNISPRFVVFLQYVLAIYLNFIIFQGLGYAISASGMPPARSSTVCMLLITYFFAWTGFFVDLTELPDWLSWVRHANPFLYSVQLLMYITMPDDVEFTCDTTGSTGDPTQEGLGCTPADDGAFVISGAEVRARFDITTEPWTCVVILLFCAVAFRLVAYALLRYELRTAIHGAQEARQRNGKTPVEEQPGTMAVRAEEIACQTVSI
jgi:hypothetical protein